MTTEQLRDRIAALFRHQPGAERLGDATPGEIADAVLTVLTVLPDSTTKQACPECGTSGACNGGPCPLGTTEQADTVAVAVVDRATVLREGDGLRARFEALAAEWEKRGEYGDSSITDRAREIRAVLAAEAQQPTPAPAEETKPEAPSAAVLLATPCDACGHTLNWHRNDVGCTVPRCVCGRFHDPEPAP